MLSRYLSLSETSSDSHSHHSSRHTSTFTQASEKPSPKIKKNPGMSFCSTRSRCDLGQQHRMPAKLPSPGRISVTNHTLSDTPHKLTDSARHCPNCCCLARGGERSGPASKQSSLAGQRTLAQAAPSVCRLAVDPVAAAAWTCTRAAAVQSAQARHTKTQPCMSTCKWSIPTVRNCKGVADYHMHKPDASTRCRCFEIGRGPLMQIPWGHTAG